MTCSQEILAYLKQNYPDAVHKGDIFAKLADLKYLPDTVSRECRRLAESGRIERIQGNSKGVSYLYKPLVAKRGKPKNDDLELWRKSRVTAKQKTLL